MTTNICEKYDFAPIIFCGQMGLPCLSTQCIDMLTYIRYEQLVGRQTAVADQEGVDPPPPVFKISYENEIIWSQ